MTATLERPALDTGRPAIHRRAWFAPASVAVLGFLVSAIGITVPAIWYDEAATITSATRSWPQLWAMVGNVDAVHALYYAGIHLVFDVFGYTPLALRLPSAIAIGASAAVIVILGRKLLRPRIGVIAAIVFCFLPRVAWAGTEGRSYAFTALLAVVLTLVFVIASAGSRRWWIAYTAVAVLACVLFLYLAFIVAAHAVTVLWRLARRERWFYRGSRRWLLAAGAAGILTLPFAAEVISQSGQVAWIHPLDNDTFHEVFELQWFYSTPVAIAGWAFIAFAVIAMLRGRASRSVLMVALPAMLLPTIGLLVMSVVLSPIYLPRYVTMSTPFVALVIAAGIDAIRVRWAAVVSVALIAALALPTIFEERMPGAKGDGEWAKVAALIASERAANGPDSTTAIIWGNVQRHPTATSRVMMYSYPDAFEGTLDPTLRVPAAETAQLWEERAPIGQSLAGLADADVTYLITSQSRDIRGIVSAAMRSAGWYPDERWNFPGVRVIKYERG